MALIIRPHGDFKATSSKNKITIKIVTNKREYETLTIIDDISGIEVLVKFAISVTQGFD